MEEVKMKTVESDFKHFIIDENHPCVMANTIFKMENYHLKLYDDMLATDAVQPILNDIQNYIDHYDFNSNQFETLIVCFKNNHFNTELEFENALWSFLQRLHNSDNEIWDPTVSDNPNDADFSFSIKGKAFFIIGMHPKSSRLSRRAPYCTVVFNLHWQFEKLREMGVYDKVKKRIRSRDKELQGSINPVLRDFGTDSETKQYSGREVESNWKCPFHTQKN